MTEARTPLVSMIVVSYNHARFVLETLDSVKAQTYTNTELIIIDDCSTDDSVALIERWLRQTGTAATFIRHDQNRGICRTVNHAVAAASGKYIAMIASDDLWLPDKTERQVEIMESQPEDVAVVYSDAMRIDSSGQCLPGLLIATNWKLDKLPEGCVLDMLMRGNCVPALTAMIRRSCYDRVGTYDEELLYEDWDMWMRIARHYSFCCSAEPVAKYRIHEKSFTGQELGRLPRGTFEVGIKQLKLGGLSESQRTVLANTLFGFASGMYEHRDGQAAEKLLLVWRATGNRRALWMSRFSRLGIGFRNWQRAVHLYSKLLRVSGVLEYRSQR